MAPWYHIDWFNPELLKGFEWEYKRYLFLIPFILLLFLLRWLFNIRVRQHLDVAFIKAKIKGSGSVWLRFLPDIFLFGFISLILVALARPQKSNEQVEKYSEGIDIMLILDTSGSMKMEDFKPNRLEATKEVARNFIKGRFKDRIGMVVFAGEAYSLSPLTTDYKLLHTLIRDIKFGMIPVDGTAIGSALAVGVNRLAESRSKSKVVILISDGENNAGNIDPNTAAELANDNDIKIYSIGMGKDGMVPFGRNFFGQTNYVQSQLDETNLREIAKIGQGKYFRATDENALEEIFRKIDTYEKSEIKETRFKDTRDFYPVYLKWAICFFLVWLFMKSSFMYNVLED